MSTPWMVLVESNTSGTGRLFARKAREQGLRPVLLASEPERYHYVAEEGLTTLKVDTQQRQALRECCRQLAAEAPLGGITSSSEYFIEAAAALAAEQGLPGPDAEALSRCRDKGRQRELLRAGGVGVPGFAQVSSPAEARAAAERLGLPVVLKPVSGSGSFGVRLCQQWEEVESHAERLLRQERNERGQPLPRRVLVEELAVGPEFSVETFDRQVIGITAKRLGPLPCFVEVGHDFPAPLAARETEALRATALQSLEALGLGWGPAHLEMRLTASGPCLIEVNPRLAGGFIPELVRQACGVDLISATLRRACGQPVELCRRWQRYAAIRFLLSPREGVLEGAEGVAEASRLVGVIEACLYVQPGARVARRGDFRDRLGHVLARGESPAECQQAVEQAHQQVRLLVRPESLPSAEGC